MINKSNKEKYRDVKNRIGIILFFGRCKRGVEREHD